MLGEISVGSDETQEERKKRSWSIASQVLEASMCMSVTSVFHTAVNQSIRVCEKSLTQKLIMEKGGRNGKRAHQLG